MSRTKPTQSERLSRGVQAEHELQLTRRAFAALREQLAESLLATPLEHKEQREYLYLSANLLPAVEQLLVGYVNDAAAAKAEIDAAELLTAAAERREPRPARPN